MYQLFGSRFHWQITAYFDHVACCIEFSHLLGLQVFISYIQFSAGEMKSSKLKKKESSCLVLPNWMPSSIFYQLGTCWICINNLFLDIHCELLELWPCENITSREYSRWVVLLDYPREPQATPWDPLQVFFELSRDDLLSGRSRWQLSTTGGHSEFILSSPRWHLITIQQTLGLPPKSLNSLFARLQFRDSLLLNASRLFESWLG